MGFTFFFNWNFFYGRLYASLTVNECISSKMPKSNAFKTSKLSICFPILNCLFLGLYEKTYINYCRSSTIYNFVVYQILMLERKISGSYSLRTALNSPSGSIEVSFGNLCFFNNSNNSLDKHPLELFVYNENLRHQR